MQANSFGETLNSVIQQTHRDLEIIVVDDGSTDDTVRIVHRDSEKGLTSHFVPASQSRRGRSQGIWASKSPKRITSLFWTQMICGIRQRSRSSTIFWSLSSDDVGLVYTIRE